MGNDVPGVTQQGEMVAAHWARLSLTLDGAMEALRSQGISPQTATAEHLHALDMLHMGGLAATNKLAEMTGIGPGQRILDVGAGVGGPARRMAHKYGARVWGLELSESIYQTALALTALVRMQEQVQFAQGSALALPFTDASFDVVVMQHVAMQIAEKDRLFGESVRVLKPGGALALHEIFAGEAGAPHFPLAWATDPATCTRRAARAARPDCRRLPRPERSRTPVSRREHGEIRAGARAAAGRRGPIAGGHSDTAAHRHVDGAQPSRGTPEGRDDRLPPRRSLENGDCHHFQAQAARALRAGLA